MSRQELPPRKKSCEVSLSRAQVAQETVLLSLLRRGKGGDGPKPSQEGGGGGGWVEMSLAFIGESKMNT